MMCQVSVEMISSESKVSYRTSYLRSWLVFSNLFKRKPSTKVTPYTGLSGGKSSGKKRDGELHGWLWLSLAK